MKTIHNIIDKLGLVLKLLSTSSNNEIEIAILKGIKRDIDKAIKEIEGEEE